MKRFQISGFRIQWLMAVAFVACHSATAAVDINQLDEGLAVAVKFKHGDDSNPLKRVEDIAVRAVTVPEDRKVVEAKIIEALPKATTKDAKNFLCRQLRFIGSAASIPALETLLSDPDGAFMARYVLARYPEPEAAQALHRRLAKASGREKVGLVHALANMNYQPLAADCVKLLKSGDADLASSAARGLGTFGGDSSVKALKAARDGATGDLRGAIDHALLRCAEKAHAEGDSGKAVAIYTDFFAEGQPERLRIAALRGLVKTHKPKAGAIMVQAIKSKSRQLRGTAISLIATVDGVDVIGQIVPMLPELDAEAQELILRALGNRGNSDAAKAVTAYVANENELIRKSALEALGLVGDKSSVGVLAKAAAASKGDEQQITRASMVMLKGDGVTDAMIAGLSDADGDIREEYVRALGGRKASSAVPTLIKLTSDSESGVRREVYRALGRVSTGDDVGKLIALADKTVSDNDDNYLRAALGLTLRRCGSPHAQTKAVLGALKSASKKAQPTLLRALAIPATDEGLAAVRARVGDADEKVNDGAVRALTEWPNAAVKDDLLTLAKTSTNEKHQILALRGYVQIAQAENSEEMLMTAMSLAKTAQDKRLVIGGLGSVSKSLEVLDAVEGFLGDDELKKEAAIAAIQIADRLRRKNKERARQTVEKVLAAVPKDRHVRGQANRLSGRLK
jgi:HEAT repeat protein